MRFNTIRCLSTNLLAIGAENFGLAFCDILTNNINEKKIVCLFACYAFTHKLLTDYQKFEIFHTRCQGYR